MKIEDTIEAVRDWFDGHGYHYEYDPERKALVGGFQIDSSIRNVRVFVTFHDEGYRVLAFSPVNGDPRRLDELLKFVARVNYGLRAGNFELDPGDGEVRFKFWVPTEGLERLPAEIIKASVNQPCFMFLHFGDAIANLAMGFSDANTEFEKALERDGG